MKTIRILSNVAVVPALLLAACASDAPVKPESESMPKSTPVPSVAAVRPHVVESPHGNRTDNYYWLRDDERNSRDVIGYLEAENAYMACLLQYIAPTLQFLIGVFIYREPFNLSLLIGFSIVWTALIIFWVENYIAHRTPVEPIPEMGEG